MYKPLTVIHCSSPEVIRISKTSIYLFEEICSGRVYLVCMLLLYIC